MSTLASKAQLRASFLRWSLFAVPLVFLLAFVSQQFSPDPADNFWYQGLTKPSFQPPAYLFGIVWPILYLLMGLALALVLSAWGAKGRTAAIIAFAVQFALNLAWSPVFFALQQIDWALYVIIAMDIAVLVTVVLFWKVRMAAGVMLFPYLAWVLFATAVNFQTLQLNPDASGGPVTDDGAVQEIEF